ncbi:MAG: ABC transporter [Verrucomicrobia bacterium]|jgi:ABC-type uncharacterized transport system involved in gliding motility auxiliary subunit|nr:ABC transporter [Verrucomicrobiota bacterium]
MSQQNKWIATLLLLLGIILATVIANRVPGQWDLTAENRYTLSPASEKLLEELREPVRMRFYFSRSSEGLPIQFKNFATRVENLLRQYERRSGGMVRLSIIDPRPDTDEEQEAIRAGLQSQPLPSGESVFFGLAVLQADSSSSIPFFTRERESFLEYDISQAVFEATQLEKPRIGILSSLELEGAPQNPMAPGQADPGYAFLDELRRTYEVEILSGDTIPSDIQSLLVIHPQALSEQQLFAIDQFVLQGRPLLVAVDPSSHLQRSQQSRQQMMMGQPTANVASDLGRLFDQWGIDYDANEVVGDRNLAAGVTVQQGAAPVRYPVWLSYNEISSDSPLLAILNSLLIVEAGSLRLRANAAEELQWTPLLRTTEDSGTVPSRMLAFPSPERVGQALESDKQAHTLAGILRGPLTTAFPEGRPAEEDEAGENAPGEELEVDTESAPFLTASEEEATVLVIADTDFLGNQFSVRMLNLLGMQGMQPINDNLGFIFNCVDSLAGNPDLIELRGKGSGTRTFTLVEAMEREAQQEYEEQLQSLEERLQEVRGRLRELQQSATSEQELIASPETQEAIEEFRLEEAEVRSQQREIRKKLREDIEALNLRLAMINLFAFPVVIVIGGFLFFYRRSRTRTS